MLIGGLLTLFAGCCSNVIFLEILVKENPGCGHLITFAQFCFISLEGLITYLIDWDVIFKNKKSSIIRARAIPIQYYFAMVSIFFTVSILNNWAFAFDIPMILHMIFRSGSLFSSMLVGFVVFRKRYPFRKVVAVFLVTFGILLATIANTSISSDSSFSSPPSYAFQGILMLTLALFLTASLGLVQECTYTRFGRDHVRESMFYTHALGLPAFYLFWKDIGPTFGTFLESESISVFGFMGWDGIYMPRLVLMLAMNALTQFICVLGVFKTISAADSLTGTLALTLRKFISILISIYYFQNPFYWSHALAVIMVIGGTLFYKIDRQEKQKTK